VYNEPSDIALLLGIPVDYQQFCERVGSSDWLSKYNYRTPDPAVLQAYLSAQWRSEYLPLVASPVQELIDMASALGVEVRTRATLLTVQEVTTRRRLIVLFAHWKGPEILAQDLKNPILAQELLERVRSDETTLGRWLQTRLEEQSLQNFSTANRFNLRRWITYPWARHRDLDLVEVLTGALALQRSDLEDKRDGVDFVLESDAARLARRRDQLDIIFHGLLLPGNRLELFDGLHNKECVETALWRDFEGLLDLTACTSTILGDYISAKRKQRVRIVEFPTVQQFAWGARCVKPALQLCTGERMSYQEARLRASYALENEVLELAKQQR
jgi:hypothetical protein